MMTAGEGQFSRTKLRALTIKENDVQVLCCPLDRPATTLALLYNALSADEQERARLYHFESDR